MVGQQDFLDYITKERGHTLEELDEALVLDLLIDCVAKTHHVLLPKSWTHEMVVEKLRSVFLGDPLVDDIVSTMMGQLEELSREDS